MNICNVIAAPSLDGEGSSAVIKEAVVVGAPVIASDLPGNREVLDDCGITVPVADPRALAGAVLRVLEDDSHSAPLAQRCRCRVHEWAPGAMAASILAAYEGLGKFPAPRPSGAC